MSLHPDEAHQLRITQLEQPLKTPPLVEAEAGVDLEDPALRMVALDSLRGVVKERDSDIPPSPKAA